MKRRSLRVACRRDDGPFALKDALVTQEENGRNGSPWFALTSYGKTGLAIIAVFLVFSLCSPLFMGEPIRFLAEFPLHHRVPLIG